MSTVLRLLGPPRIERAGVPVRFALKRGWAILALVFTHDRVSREQLVTWLWPDDAPDIARGKLRRTLHEVGRATGGDVIEVDGDAVTLRSCGDCWCDLAALREALRASRRSGYPAASGEEVRSWDLESSELLEGVSLSSCDAFEEWLFLQRETVRQTAIQMLTLCADQAERQLRSREAEQFARTLVVLNPLDEPATRRLMRLLSQQGHRAAALSQLERLRTALHDELGLELDPDTVAMGERLRSGQHESGTESSGSRDELPIPDVQYTENRGVHLAYQIVGEGPLDVACIPGFISNLEQGWAAGGPRPFFQWLAGRARVLLFDRRGVGLSDRVGHVPSVDATVDDLDTVLDAAGARRPVLMGFSEGGPAAIAFAAQNPDRVAGLVLYGSMARGSYADDYPWALRSEQFNRWLDLLTTQWGHPSSIEAFAPGHSHDPGLARWWSRMLRMSSSPGGMRAVLRAFEMTDVRHLLGRIAVPTLILHREGDCAVPVGAGRHLADSIHAAQWKALPGTDHWWWLGDTAPLIEAVSAFLATLAASAVACERTTDCSAGQSF